MNPLTTRVILAQHGSRHRYALPQALESVGMLEAFYTDFSAHSFLGRCASAINGGKGCSALAGRRISGVPVSKIFQQMLSFSQTSCASKDERCLFTNTVAATRPCLQKCASGARCAPTGFTACTMRGSSLCALPRVGGCAALWMYSSTL